MKLKDVEVRAFGADRKNVLFKGRTLKARLLIAGFARHSKNSKNLTYAIVPSWKARIFAQILVDEGLTLT